MRTIPVIALLGCLLAACATPPSTESSGQENQTSATAVDSSNAASNEPKTSTVSATMFSELSDSLPDDNGITSQYLPDNSIALRLAGDNAFAFDRADIRPEQATALESVTAVLQRYPESHIEIVGYTDNIGSDKYNKLLSAKRAQSVADVLVKQGVPASSIQTLGAGMANPVADNNTPEGRSQNRRVEIHIVAE